MSFPSLSLFRLMAACLLLIQVTAFLSPQAPLNAGRPAFVAPPPSLNANFKPSPTIIASSEEPRVHNTRLYASFGFQMIGLATATRPLVLRATAVFLASFSFFWAANRALLRSSIPVSKTEIRGCPLFNSANVNTNNSTSGQAHGFSGKRFLGSLRKKPDLRLWLLKRMGRRPVVSVSTADTDLTAQVNQLEFVQTLALPTQNNGLLNTTDANRHAYLRRLLEQAFNPQALSEAVPRLQQVAQETLEAHILLPLAKFPRYASINIPEICEDCVLDTVLCHYLGLSPLALGKEEEFAILREAVRAYTMQDPSTTRHGVHHQRRWLPWRRKSSSSSSSKKHYRHKAKAGAYLRQKIEEQMQCLKQHPDSSVLCQLIWAKETNDYSINTLADQEVVDSMLCLIAAGAQSTSQAMTTALVEVLGTDPIQYQRLVQEQRASSSLQHQNHKLDLEAPTLRAVVDEALSLHPNPRSPRLVTEPVKLESGPRVPRGWLVQLVPSSSAESSSSSTSTSSSSSSSSSNTNNVLLPEDTTPQNHKPSTPSSSMDSNHHRETAATASSSPFGEGPRACLGQSLALLQLKVFLATLAKSVDSYRVLERERTSAGRGGEYMDQVVLYDNASTESGSFATCNNVVVLETIPTSSTNLEYATTVTAEWMRDAIESSPTAFS